MSEFEEIAWKLLRIEMVALGVWVSQVSIFVTQVKKFEHGAGFLQPRRVSCSDVEYSPSLMVGSRFSDVAIGKPIQHRNSQHVDVEELEAEVELLQRKLATEAATAEQLRQEVKSLTSRSLHFGRFLTLHCGEFCPIIG